MHETFARKRANYPLHLTQRRKSATYERTTTQRLRFSLNGRSTEPLSPSEKYRNLVDSYIGRGSWDWVHRPCS